MQSQEITQDFFIKPGIDLQQNSQELLTMVNLSKDQLRQRWNTQPGQYIISHWKGHRFDRQSLESLVGKYYGQTDIRGIPLDRQDLTKVDLSKVDLFGANLENAILKYANLSDSWLSESNIKGACFDFANMTRVLIDNVEFNGKTSFYGVNLNAVNFTLAVLLQDFATGQQRIENLKTRHPILAVFLRITCDYGRSFTRFFLCCVLAIFSFALLYLIPGCLNKPGFWNSLYFSALTFTTLGSDIQPVSMLGKIFLILEAAIGYLMTGLLVAILVRKTIGD